MRVGFTDPQGLRRWRAAPYLVPLAVFLLAFLPIEAESYASTCVFLAALLFNLIGVLPLQQQKPRAAELVCGAGYIEIKNAGTRNQRIRAKDITGGTSARTRRGFIFTMQVRGRSQPLTLELSSEEELARVRHALGVGHGGFGTVAWATKSDSNNTTAFAGRIVASTVAALMVLVELGVTNRMTATALETLLGIVGAIGGLLGIFGLFGRSSDPSVVMGADGLKLNSRRGWFALPYHMLARIEDVPQGFLFYMPPPNPPVAVERSSPALRGLSMDERKVLMAQITSAAQRARGMGPQKEDVRGRVDQLRRHGESPRDWLVRLDLAGQMISSGSGYRGNHFDIEDLWLVLEDPEAEPELRAAAARILRHSPKPEARIRIDAAVAAVRDEATNKRLRIAVRDDVDEASQELAFLEQGEQPRVMYPQTYPTSYGR